MPSVLVVSDWRNVLEVLGRAFEREGFEVLTCCGPTGPSYMCIGVKYDYCPLPLAADVIVLDCDLASDAALEGTTSWELAQVYVGLQKPVVALARREDLADGLFEIPGVQVLPREADASRVTSAAKEALSGGCSK